MCHIFNVHLVSDIFKINKMSLISCICIFEGFPLINAKMFFVIINVSDMKKNPELYVELIMFFLFGKTL